MFKCFVSCVALLAIGIGLLHGLDVLFTWIEMRQFTAIPPRHMICIALGVGGFGVFAYQMRQITLEGGSSE